LLEAGDDEESLLTEPGRLDQDTEGGLPAEAMGPTWATVGDATGQVNPFQVREWQEEA
jgi:hypothetical protein